jgi:site-specific recombinase XerD
MSTAEPDANPDPGSGPQTGGGPEAGSREVSRARLAARRALVAEAAALLHAAAGDALEVTGPDPLAVAIEAIATQLDAHHRSLDAPATTVPGGDMIVAEDGAPAWARPVIDTAARWIHRGYTSSNSKKAIANALGIPRADQRLWRGEPTHRNVRAVPEPTTFFPWCASIGLNPLTDMSREALRAWITMQDDGGVKKTTQKARLGAVSAWYREMRSLGETTFEVPAVLSSAERENLGVRNPDPAAPTVPLTLDQARALRAAAQLHPYRATRLRNQIIVAVLTTTGIRAEELCALDRRDVHRAGPDGEPALWIAGKGDEGRWVRLPGMALELIGEYLDAPATNVVAVRGPGSATPARQPLLLTVSGKRLETQHVTDTLQGLCRSLIRAAEASTSSVLAGHAAALRPIASTVHPRMARYLYANAAEEHGTDFSPV